MRLVALTSVFHVWCIFNTGAISWRHLFPKVCAFTLLPCCAMSILFTQWTRLLCLAYNLFRIGILSGKLYLCHHPCARICIYFWRCLISVLTSRCLVCIRFVACPPLPNMIVLLNVLLLHDATIPPSGEHPCKYFFFNVCNTRSFHFHGLCCRELQ